MHDKVWQWEHRVIPDSGEPVLQAAFKREDLYHGPYFEQAADLMGLDETMRELLRVLRPGGLLMFSTFGPNTLQELRACWQQIDDAVHVNQFTDMHDVGDELLRSGFADPVMEAEVITVNYEAVDVLMADLRAIGANATAEGGRTGLTAPAVVSRIRQAYEHYRQDGLLPATYEVVYGHAWVPEQGVMQERRGDETRITLAQMKAGMHPPQN